VGPTACADTRSTLPVHVRPAAAASSSPWSWSRISVDSSDPQQWSLTAASWSTSIPAAVARKQPTTTPPRPRLLTPGPTGDRPPSRFRATTGTCCHRRQPLAAGASPESGRPKPGRAAGACARFQYSSHCWCHRPGSAGERRRRSTPSSSRAVAITVVIAANFSQGTTLHRHENNTHWLFAVAVGCTFSTRPGQHQLATRSNSFSPTCLQQSTTSMVAATVGQEPGQVSRASQPRPRLVLPTGLLGALHENHVQPRHPIPYFHSVRFNNLFGTSRLTLEPFESA
jgi:hypothetical protein